MNNSITKKKTKIALIHVAKTETGLTDDEYRALLFGVAGITSAAELEREDQFADIMDAFKRFGFIGSKPLSHRKDSWGGTARQRAKIEALWRLVARDNSDKALKRFIRRITHVDSPRWLNVQLAQMVILALETMKAKAEGKMAKREIKNPCGRVAGY
jgi:hypothetical protein